MTRKHLTVIASTSLHPGLRGTITAWAAELLPGIYVAMLTTKQGQALFDLIEHEMTESSGTAHLLRHDTTNEAGYTITTIGAAHHYTPRDFHGLTLIEVQHELRPIEPPPRNK